MLRIEVENFNDILGNHTIDMLENFEIRLDMVEGQCMPSMESKLGFNWWMKHN
jgi:hypothetical protein